jgi:uncharacterized protein (DUF362 family)
MHTNRNVESAWMDRLDVSATIRPGTTYPGAAPFHPSERYPENPFGSTFVGKENAVYRAFRDALAGLGLDRDNFDTIRWNPFGSFIRPGDRVFVKPNLVEDFHLMGQEALRATVTHGSVLRAVLDYVLIALGGKGSIFIGDSPIKETNFQKVLELTGTAAVASFVQDNSSIPVEVFDIRDLGVKRLPSGIMDRSEKLPGDPRGYVLFDLKEKSFFCEIDDYSHLYRSTASFYENEIARAHNRTRHLYSVSRTLMESDVLISIPKMKVHRKAGVTLALKNMIGTTNKKEWLAHHRYSSPRHGGDMFPDDASRYHKLRETVLDFLVHTPVGKVAARWAVPLLGMQMLARLEDPSRRIEWSEGDWWGNDTIWRTALDLNVAVLFGDREGRIHPEPARSFFAVIDGIWAGEREGPLMPTPKHAGALVCGFNPVAVDWAAARLMGLDPERVPLLKRAAGSPGFPPGREVREDTVRLVLNGMVAEPWPNLGFIPPKGWQGRVELEAKAVCAPEAATHGPVERGR